MRVLNERYADGNVDTTDGIKIFDARGWVQVLPDGDEPTIHLYAEGETPADSEELETELRHARHRPDRTGGDRRGPLN